MEKASALEVGKVKWYNIRRGFGFITANKDSKDIFVNWRGIMSDKKFKALFEGQEVVFKRNMRPKGEFAELVSVLNPLNNLPEIQRNSASEETKDE